MALTREFKDTVVARVQSDPAFAQALLDEAITLFINGEPDHEQHFGGFRGHHARAQGRGAYPSGDDLIQAFGSSRVILTAGMLAGFSAPASAESPPVDEIAR